MRAGRRGHFWSSKGKVNLEERKKASISHLLWKSAGGAPAHVELNLHVRVKRVYREVLSKDAVEPEEELLRRVRPAATQITMDLQ